MVSCGRALLGRRAAVLLVFDKAGRAPRLPQHVVLLQRQVEQLNDSDAADQRRRHHTRQYFEGFESEQVACQPGAEDQVLPAAAIVSPAAVQKVLEGELL